MSDTTDKPKLGTRAPLGLKRTVETGKVKQSFSHGRSNTVVVEVKKRRILGRPGEAEAAKPEPVVAAPEPALQEVAGDAAVFTDDLAAGITRALAERERLAAAGIARAQLFTWRETARLTADVYRSVLAA